jgi:hypothetical protein
MLKSILILLLGAAIGAAAYALISRMSGEVDPGPSYETAIKIVEGRKLVDDTRVTSEYRVLRTNDGAQLRSLVISKAALLKMMARTENNFAGIRLYPIFKPSLVQGGAPSFSMVVVPMVKSGTGLGDYLEDNYMFDYLNPCPAACPLEGAALRD